METVLKITGFILLVPTILVSFYLFGRFVSAGWYRGKLDFIHKVTKLQEPKDGK